MTAIDTLRDKAMALIQSAGGRVWHSDETALHAVYQTPFCLSRHPCRAQYPRLGYHLLIFEMDAAGTPPEVALYTDTRRLRLYWDAHGEQVQLYTPGAWEERLLALPEKQP